MFSISNKGKDDEIARLVEVRKTERDEQVQHMIKEISELLDEQHMKYRIFGRSKHSAYTLIKRNKKRYILKKFSHSLAIRIVTDTDTACYEDFSISMLNIVQYQAVLKIISQCRK